MVSDIYSPELRIFLSVDLIGSTAFKQHSTAAEKTSEQLQTWLISFSDFYSEFKLVYLRALSRSNDYFGVEGYDKPTIWKKLGDELIFSAALHSVKEPFFYVECFRIALVEYEKEIHRQGWPLGLKGTAWTAGFPVRNVKIADDAVEAVCYDYIGPCIDLGFRLGKFATARKFVLSVELVWLILSFIEDQKDFSVYYDGKAEVKGFRGISYPVFWTSKLGKRSNDNEMLLLNLQPCSHSDIKNFCKDFIASNSNDLQFPFIIGEERLKEYVPKDYDNKCKIAKDMRLGKDSSLSDGMDGQNDDTSKNDEIATKILSAIPAVNSGENT